MDVKDLIEDLPEHHRFRVHRSTLTSPELFEMERKAVLSHSWLYVGHESEIPKPGDFVRRSVGGRPLILVRDRQGIVRTFLNSCPHRGAMICREDRGSTRAFTCFYHAWTFETDGRLLRVPDDSGYGAEWSSNGKPALHSPPRTQSYRGLVFVSFAASIVDLEAYLGPARYYLDLILDQSQEGMRIVEGSQRYTIKANWKLMVENSLDGYHAPLLHSTYFAYVANGEGKARPLPAGRGLTLGNGHAVMLARHTYPRPVARWNPVLGEHTRPLIQETRRRLVDRFEESRAFEIAELTKNLFIYPNLVINDGVAVTVRKIDAVAPDEMDVTAWALAPAEEDEDLVAVRLDSYLTFYGPGGFATPDDVEALESCQAGFRAGHPEWSDISRGMGRQPLHTDEVQMRTFWRRWHAEIQGLPVPQEREAPGPVDWSEIEAAFAAEQMRTGSQ